MSVWYAPYPTLITYTRICELQYIDSLTYDDNDNHEDDDYQNNPQLHILPPQLTLKSGGRALKHVSILIEVVW